MTAQQVEFIFSPVGKLSQTQKALLLRIETGFISLATDIINDVPNCADRTSALRKLLEAKFMCSQAITHVLPNEEETNGKEETKKSNA